MFMVKDQSVELREKVGLQVVPAINQYSSIFWPGIPLKQPKNAKIGQNRLYLGDFAFQNSQIGHKINWTYVNR